MYPKLDEHLVDLCVRALPEVKLCFTPAWGEPFLSRLNSTNLLNRVCAAFPEHASVGETCLQHARHSFQFGFAMACESVAAFIHAVVPALCTATGSCIIVGLYGRMILNRTRLRVRAQSSLARESFLAEHI